MNSGSLKAAAEAISVASRQAAQGLIERETIIDLILLAAVAREHLLIIGPPGTAKSAAVRRVAQSLGGNYFEYLLGRFTEPSELFGPVDIRKLREGTVETLTEGMLPEADIAFLDEVFLGSTAVLNTLLGILNERVFRRGHTKVPCPLRVCVAASNQMPEEESLTAFADRFLIHAFVEPVPDALLEELLLQGWRSEHRPLDSTNRLHQLDQLTQAAHTADLSPVQPLLAHCIRLLRKEGIRLSDRRIVKSQALISAAACLAGRSAPSAADLWPLVYVLPTADTQALARDILRQELAASENATLTAAAVQASLGPKARAQMLTDRINALLQAETTPNLLALEAIGREVDAHFAPDQIPESLQAARERLKQYLDRSTHAMAAS